MEALIIIWLKDVGLNYFKLVIMFGDTNPKMASSTKHTFIIVLTDHYFDSDGNSN